MASHLVDTLAREYPLVDQVPVGLNSSILPRLIWKTGNPIHASDWIELEYARALLAADEFRVHAPE